MNKFQEISNQAVICQNKGFKNLRNPIFKVNVACLGLMSVVSRKIVAHECKNVRRSDTFGFKHKFRAQCLFTSDNSLFQFFFIIYQHLASRAA